MYSHSDAERGRLRKMQAYRQTLRTHGLQMHRVQTGRGKHYDIKDAAGRTVEGGEGLSDEGVARYVNSLRPI